MYEISQVVQRIKLLARAKGVKTTEMLESCELSKNTLSSMSGRGSWIQANSLGKIADYLECSVDYLLGRTNSPNQIETHIGENNSGNFVNGNNGDNSPLTIGGTALDEMSVSLLKNFNALETTEKARILVMIDDLRKGA